MTTTADLLAVFDSWTTSGRGFSQASDKLAAGTNQLCGQLTTAGAAWGQDQIGQAFFNGGQGKPGFGALRDEVLPQIADMVSALGGTGASLTAAGAVYKAAELANTLGAGTPPGVTVRQPAAYRLPPYTGGMAVSDPPPGELMQILHLVQSLVLGCEWPDGSISAMGQIRDALSAAATMIGQVITDVHRAASQVTSSNLGHGTENFTKVADQVIKGLGQLEQACQGLASSTDNLIRQKQAARIQFIASLVFLLASFLVAQALAFFTLGGSEVEFLTTAEIEAQALRAFLQGIVRAVIEGMWYSGGMDAIGQLAKMHTGAQHGFSAGEFFTSVGEGAIFGLVAGSLGGGAKFGAIKGSVVLKALTNILETQGIRGTAARLVFSSLTGTLGGVVGQAVVTQHVNWAQAAEFGAGMAIMGEATEHGKNIIAASASWVHTTFRPAGTDFASPPADHPDDEPTSSTLATVNGGTVSEALGTTLHHTGSSDLSADGSTGTQAADQHPPASGTAHPDAPVSDTPVSDTTVSDTSGPPASGQAGTRLADATPTTGSPAADPHAADPETAGGIQGQHSVSEPSLAAPAASLTGHPDPSFSTADHPGASGPDDTGVARPADAVANGTGTDGADPGGSLPGGPGGDLPKPGGPDAQLADLGAPPLNSSAPLPDTGSPVRGDPSASGRPVGSSADLGASDRTGTVAAITGDPVETAGSALSPRGRHAAPPADSPDGSADLAAPDVHPAVVTPDGPAARPDHAAQAASPDNPADHTPGHEANVPRHHDTAGAGSGTGDASGGRPGIKIDDLVKMSPQHAEFLRYAASVYGDRFIVHDWNDKVSQNIEDFSRVPPRIHEVVARYLDIRGGNAGVYFGEGGVPELDDLGYLSGVSPHGRRETWDDVAGAYRPDKGVLAIGTKEHGGTSVALHEYGHLVDDVYGGLFGNGKLLSSTRVWKRVYKDVLDAQDQPGLIQPYFRLPDGKGEKEMIAEAFARYRLPDPEKGLADLAGSSAGGEALMRYFRGLLGPDEGVSAGHPMAVPDVTGSAGQSHSTADPLAPSAHDLVGAVPVTADAGTPSEVAAVGRLARGSLSDVNQALASGRVTDLDAVGRLDAGISKLPEVGQRTVRVAAEDMWPEKGKGAVSYQKGAVIRARGYTVLRTEPDHEISADAPGTATSHQLATAGKDAFVLDAATARRIDPALTGEAGAERIVFERDTTFEVSGVQTDALGSRTIHIREVTGISAKAYRRELPPPSVDRSVFESALRDAGFDDLSPAPEAPAEIIRGLRGTEPEIASGGARPSPDVSRLARTLARALSGPEADGARLLPALHQARDDPLTAERLRAAYTGLTGHDLDTDIERAGLTFDPRPYLTRLLGGDPAAGMESGALRDTADSNSSAFRSALHDAIGDHDGNAASRLLEGIGRKPERLWALDDEYQRAYGSGIEQHIDTVFGASPEGDYLRYLAGDQSLATPAVTASEARELFRHLEASTFRTSEGVEAPLPFGHPENGCYERAHRMDVKLAEWGYKPGKIFAARGSGISVLTESARWGEPGRPLEVSWKYHVASLIKVEADDGHVIDVVMDPSLGDKPLTVDQWLSRMGISRGDYLKFDMSQHDPSAIAEVNNTVLRPLANGMFGSDTALVYTAGPGQYWADTDFGSLRGASSQSATMAGEFEAHAAVAEARAIRSHVLSLLRSRGGWRRDPAAEVAGLISQDPRYAILRSQAARDAPWPGDIMDSAWSPDETAKLRRVMATVRDRLQGREPQRRNWLGITSRR